VTFQLVAWCLNQVRYRAPSDFKCGFLKMYAVSKINCLTLYLGDQTFVHFSPTRRQSSHDADIPVSNNYIISVGGNHDSNQATTLDHYVR
jgi:hypothetical protein